MPLQDQPRIRKALLAGAVAIALTGAGAALAWSADSLPSSVQPAAQQLASGQENRPDKQDRPGKQDRPSRAQRPQLQHSESVVKNPDGTFTTEMVQRGTVETVSATSITVKSEDGFSQSYALTAETKVRPVPAAPPSSGLPGTDDGGKRPGADGSIADIAVGDAVRISGSRNGDQVSAERIVEGAVEGLGRGNGNGLGKGPGKGLGKGLGRDDGSGQAQ